MGISVAAGKSVGWIAVCAMGALQLIKNTREIPAPAIC